MAPPRQVQEEADRMVAYFWPQVEELTEDNVARFGELKLDPSAKRAIAMS